MALGSLVNLILRLAQIAFAAIVAGVNGQILHESRGASSWALGRFIYTETIAGLSLFIPVIWVFLAGGHFSWVLDIIISLCWWAAFGLLVDVSVPSPPNLQFFAPHFPRDRSLYALRVADSCPRRISMEVLVAPRSTGATSACTATTHAASSRLSSLSRSCRPSSGSPLPSLTSSGPAATAQLSRLPITVDGIAATSKSFGDVEELLALNDEMKYTNGRDQSGSLRFPMSKSKDLSDWRRKVGSAKGLRFAKGNLMQHLQTPSASMIAYLEGLDCGFSGRG
jgi:hypothetical protein